MAGTIVNGTGLYGGLPVSQYEGKSKLNVGTAGSDEIFWMLWRTFGDCLRATALGYHVANSNTQPEMLLNDINITVPLDTWYFVLSNLKPDFRYLDCFESFVEYVNFNVEFYVGELAPQEKRRGYEDDDDDDDQVQPMQQEPQDGQQTPQAPGNDKGKEEVDSDGEFGGELTLDAIAEAFFDSAPIGKCTDGASDLDYVISVDKILEPMVRFKYARGSQPPVGPSIEYDAQLLAENRQTFRTLEESMPYYEAAARIIPRALAIAAWGEYALRKQIDVRKTLSYKALVFDFTTAVANFLYSFDLIGFSGDIEIRRVDFVPDVDLPTVTRRNPDTPVAMEEEEEDDDEPEPVERRGTRSTGPVTFDQDGQQSARRKRTKQEKRLMREIETVALILAKPGDMDKIGAETTQDRIAQVINSSFGVRLQRLLARLPLRLDNKVADLNAELMQQKTNLETAIRETEQKIASPGPSDNTEELIEDLDGLRTALTDIDEDIASLEDKIKEEVYLNAYRTNISRQPRAFLLDLFEQFERSVSKINKFVVRDPKDEDADEENQDEGDDDNTPGAGDLRPFEFFADRNIGGFEYDNDDLRSFRPDMERISDKVRFVQANRLVLGPNLTINETNASGDKYYQLTRATDTEEDTKDATFIDDAGWVDLFSFLYSTGELFLDWQRKLALEIDIQGRLLTEEFFGIAAKPGASVSIDNVTELAKGNTTVADIKFKIGGNDMATYKTRIQ